jgi:hypothetical protein
MPRFEVTSALEILRCSECPEMNSEWTRSIALLDKHTLAILDATMRNQVMSSQVVMFCWLNFKRKFEE